MSRQGFPRRLFSCRFGDLGAGALELGTRIAKPNEPLERPTTTKGGEAPLPVQDPRMKDASREKQVGDRRLLARERPARSAPDGAVRLILNQHYCADSICIVSILSRIDTAMIPPLWSDHP